MQETENLKLKKPDLNDYVNIGDLNENADVIDAAVTKNKEDLAAHLAEYVQQLGTAALQTADQTLKGAINEVFQAGNNVKSNTVDALLSVDDSLLITTESTWKDIIDSMRNISTGLLIDGKPSSYGALSTPNIYPEILNVAGEGYLHSCFTAGSGQYVSIEIDGVRVFPENGSAMIPNASGITFLYKFKSSLIVRAQSPSVGVVYTLGEDLITVTPKIVTPSNTQSVGLRKQVTGSGFIHGIYNSGNEYIKLVVDGVQIAPEDGSSSSLTRSIPMLVRFEQGFEFYAYSSNQGGIAYTLDN